MSDFAERLEGLIIEREMNRKTFAERVGINATSITHYLEGKRLPTVENLVKIADYFQCSTDFLLGREDVNSTLTFKPCPAFPEQLEFLKKRFNCSSYQIYRNGAVSKSAYYEWKSGKRVPSLENVIRLADRFDCRVDFILGRES